ncbi:MAG: histidinol-phosphatase [Hyphomonadaceae bacterium]
MTPPPEKIAELRAFAGALADAAHAAILPHFRTALDVEAKAGVKPGFDPVTVADRNAEAAMRALIEKTYPDHAILGEEFGEKPGAGEYAWVLDPIDGTRAFISGLPLWGVLIGLVREGAPLIGVIDQPYIGERFTGFPGGAAYESRAGSGKLRARPCARLTEATFSTTDPHLFAGAEAGAVEMVRQTAKLTRFGCDCYAYAMVASGHIDIVIESGLASWDVAALAPVVEGAGGALRDWTGRPLHETDWFMQPAGRGQIVAVGDARVLDDALVALKRAAR